MYSFGPCFFFYGLCPGMILQDHIVALFLVLQDSHNNVELVSYKTDLREYLSEKDPLPSFF